MNDSIEKRIVAGEQVSLMLESNAWKEYVGPLLDRMIVDIIGGKENGRWLSTPPKLNERTIATEEFRFLLGYKASLIDFHDGIHSIIDDADAAKGEKIKLLEEEVDV